MTTHLLAPLLSYLPADLHVALQGSLRPGAPLRAAWQRGTHLARTRGDGADFHEHRPYVAGDDLRRIDWRAAARADKTVLRESEREIVAPLLVVLDGSGALAYGEGERGKWRQAQAIAAALWVLARQQGDPIGLLASSQGRVISAWERPSLRYEQVDALAQCLQHTQAAGICAWVAMFARLQQLDLRNTTVVIISDFLDLREQRDQDPQACDAMLDHELARLRSRCPALQVVQVLHRDELTFPFGGGLAGADMLQLSDPRNNAAAKLGQAERMREPYLAAVHQHLARQHTTWLAQGVQHFRHVTDEPLAPMIHAIAEKSPLVLADLALELKSTRQQVEVQP